MIKILINAFVILATTQSFAGNPSKNSTQRKVSSEVSENEVREKAKQYEMGCSEDAPVEVEKFSNKFRYSYETPKDREHEAQFFIVSCLVGAYNSASVLLYNNPYHGLDVVPLSSPFVNEKSSKIIGWIAENVVGRLSYDPKTKTLSSFSKGRGLGDISQLATYAILENNVLLRKYEIDSTPDGKMNQKIIFESKEPLAP